MATLKVLTARAGPYKRRDLWTPHHRSRPVPTHVCAVIGAAAFFQPRLGFAAKLEMEHDHRHGHRKQTKMPLTSSGPNGWVSFEIGVKLVMRDENGATVLVAVDSDVLDFFENPILDDDVACFRRHRDKIERVASALYDAGLMEDGRVRVTYGDLRRL